MTQTKDQQQKAVVVGMALGVLAQGVAAVTSNKMAVESAFNYAWRRWSAAGRFPSIKGHNPGNQFWMGLGKSERRSGVCAAWDRDRWCSPYTTYEGWTVEEALEHHADADVGPEEWMELGQHFVDYFKPEEIQLPK